MFFPERGTAPLDRARPGLPAVERLPAVASGAPGTRPGTAPNQRAEAKPRRRRRPGARRPAVERIELDDPAVPGRALATLATRGRRGAGKRGREAGRVALPHTRPPRPRARLIRAPGARSRPSPARDAAPVTRRMVRGARDRAAKRGGRGVGGVSPGLGALAA